MGAWLARELTRTASVKVFDKRSGRLEKIPQSERLAGLAELRVFKPDILLNCVNLQKTIEVFQEAAGFLDSSCILADIASIKGVIPDFYRSSGFRFISMHPMFGPHFTNLKDLRDENVILISESDRCAKRFFRQFFKLFELNINEYSFSSHDELMAYSLTLPFVSSIVFSACLTQHIVPGTTFSRHKMIARKLFQEDDELLAEVLFNEGSTSQIEKICSRLEFLKHVIQARDYEEACKFFSDLRKKYAELE